MTVAMWILSSFLIVAITLVCMGAAIRPYTIALAADRDSWKARALAAEADLAHHDDGSVKLVQIDPTDPDLEVWTRGLQ